MVGRRGRAVLLLFVLLPACSGDDDSASDDRGDRVDDSETSETTAPLGPSNEPAGRGTFDTLIPRPVQVTPGAEGAEGTDFVVRAGTVVELDEGAEGEGGTWAAELLRGYITAATGLETEGSGEGADGAGTIRFTTEGAEDLGLGDEGYELHISEDQVEVVATGGAGFGWAAQTIRQLLPPEGTGADTPVSWTLPGGTVHDVPRFAWRGAMLDVARHFFPPADVERVIDLLAQYKLNRLHLHLTDDQGWRLESAGYPELTAVGATTEAGGGEGGFYTQSDFRRLVDYAAQRGVMIVPEIDLPGHTTAALAAVPGLNCGPAPAGPSTDWSDGSSSLCIQAEQTSPFVRDIVTEVAALTLGPYLHIGGDEAQATSPEDYQLFLAQVTRMVQDAGKQPVGWDEIGTTDLPPGSVVQYWNSDENLLAGVARGASVVMSPASRAYMDMKYDPSTPLGLTWAGLTDTQDAYEWDPASIVGGVPIERILGLEAPLWTETVTTLGDIELMMLPRLPGYAELGWSPADGRSWDEYRVRLASHAPRWTATGRSFTADPSVPWP